jgi:hypothetical protein
MATDELTMVFDAADFVSMNLVPAGVVKAEALIFLELNTASADAWFTSYNNTLAIVNSSVADSEYLVHFIGEWES